MTQQLINLGIADKGNGDPLRTAFGKVNNNFNELYARSENTDAQTLTLVGDTLSITGGNSVDLSKYEASTPSNWDGTAPTTIGTAIDRLAALVKVLNSGTGA